MHIKAIRDNSRQRNQLLETARNLPTTATEYFEKSLERIRERRGDRSYDRDIALASLFWVLHAKRPLGVHEFPEAVASVLHDLTARDPELYLVRVDRILDLSEGQTRRSAFGAGRHSWVLA
jgi:hypothetical protein